MKMQACILISLLMSVSRVCSEDRPVTDADFAPPVVVKTLPEAGSRDVEPGEREIRVVFSKEMMDRSWSPVDVWSHSGPEIVGAPKYDKDQRSWSVKVRLQPGKTYGWWLNTPEHANFKDAHGRSAVPYLLTFQTRTK